MFREPAVRIREFGAGQVAGWLRRDRHRRGCSFIASSSGYRGNLAAAATVTMQTPTRSFWAGGSSCFALTRVVLISGPASGGWLSTGYGARRGLADGPGNARLRATYIGFPRRCPVNFPLLGQRFSCCFVLNGGGAFGIFSSPERLSISGGSVPRTRF